MKFDFESMIDLDDISWKRTYKEDITTMSGAQLHFKTAPCIMDALKNRAMSGIYGWTGSDYPEYLNSIYNWMKKVRKWKITREWIVPTYGTLQSMSCAIRAFTNEGDGVIVQPPVYVLYDRVIKRTNREKVCNPLVLKDNKYFIDFENLEYIMSNPKNKLMFFCNPHNPIMSIWDKDILDKVSYLAKKYNVLVVVDEIFAEHTFYGNEIYPYGDTRYGKDNCIICTSLGKAFNFTGLSHANIIIPNDKIRNQFIVQRNNDHYGSLDPFMYDAVLAAYTDDGKAWIDALIKYVNKSIELVKSFLNIHFPQIKVCNHQAGTLLWIDFRELGLSEEELHIFLKDEAGIIADKGSDYGVEGTCFCRFQLGLPKKEIEKALDRLLTAGIKRGFAV